MQWRKSKYKELGSRYTDYRGEYKVWQHMIDRCTNEKSAMYYCYGARGIKVCPEWLSKETGFVQFYKDMGQRPREDDGRPYQLDRIDVDGDYCPENCRWVTMLQNARNKRNNVEIFLWGERYCFSEACSILGLSQGSVKGAAQHYGLSCTDALIRHLIRTKGAKEISKC